VTPVPFGWRDVLDILLVALVIYRIFNALPRHPRDADARGRRRALAASLAARQLELHSLGWLLDTLCPSGWWCWSCSSSPSCAARSTSIGHAHALRALIGSGGVDAALVDEMPPWPARWPSGGSARHRARRGRACASTRSWASLLDA